MKKINLIILVSLLATTSVSSQITFTPKAGVTISTVSFSDDILNAMDADISYKVGFVGGVAAAIPLKGDLLTLQPELLWIQKGYWYGYEEPGYEEDYNYTLNYLELPVLVKVNAGRFYAALGPSISYGLFGRYKGTYTETGQTHNDKGTVKFGTSPNNYQGDDEYIDNRVDFGLQVGAGAKISVLVLDIRYGIGFSDLYDKHENFTGDTKSQNRCIQITLGVPLGR